MKPTNEAVTAAHSTPGTKPAGLDVEYNHDLNPSEAFLSAYPLLRDSLKDHRLFDAFTYFDKEARVHKRAFQSFGLWSLILGLVPLIVAALRMVVGEPLFAHVVEINIAAESCGVVSVGVVLWMRMRRHRGQWCQAAFCRERLRQWHFQKFLDGSLIEMSVSHKARYQDELDRRWGELQQNLQDGYGMMVEFIRFASHNNDFFHHTNEYTDRHIAKLVFEALWTLRFEHQLRYSRRKLEPEGEQAGLALEERTALAETVASVTLAGAIVMSALAFVVSGAHLFSLGSWLPWDSQTITRCLGGTALFLVVLSAASRAYRTGYTLPGESESYDEYCDRVRELKAVFKSISNDKDRLRELEHLEEEAAAELRRFLRMKTRATFVS